MEDNLLYMDVHLNIPKTKDATNPMAAIATVSAWLESWLQYFSASQENEKSYIDNSTKTKSHSRRKEAATYHEEIDNEEENDGKKRRKKEEEREEWQQCNYGRRSKRKIR